MHLKIVHHFLNVKQINDAFIDKANHVYIAMPMYNLSEYSDNYSETSGPLWLLKRDEPPENNIKFTNTNLNIKQ